MVYVVYPVYEVTNKAHNYHMEVPQWVWSWDNGQTIEFIVFFKIMSKLGTFSTLLGWVQAPETELKQSMQYQTKQCIWECIQLGVLYPVVCSGKMYLDISGHIWSHLDVPRCIWSEMAESSLRCCILFPGSDRTYLDLPRCIWTYLDVSGHIWSYLEVLGEGWVQVWSKWGIDSIQTSSTPHPAGAKTM